MIWSHFCAFFASHGASSLGRVGGLDVVRALPDGLHAADHPRVLRAVLVEGPIARQIGRLDDTERRRAILAELVRRFGDKAASPIDYLEQNWTTERYSGGGMLSHAPTGVLTDFGPALREPCGRIHWAGTESSAVMCGWVDGAVRSGERAAAEVMQRERVGVA